MILVTGGTGRVGSRLVPLLLDKGEDVRVLSRDVARGRAVLGDRVDIRGGDLGSPDAVRQALVGADRVFLLTPGGQVEHERTVITAARDAGVRRVVKLSALGAHEHSTKHFTRWHRESEKALEASGLAATILRPSGFMQGFFQSISDDRLYTAVEDGPVALVDARDIAAVAAAALTEEGHEGMTYALTGPEAVTYDQAARTLSDATGREITHVRVPPEAVVEGLIRAGAPAWLAHDLAILHCEFAAGRGADVSDDVEAVTGRRARTLHAFAREEFALR